MSAVIDAEDIAGRIQAAGITPAELGAVVRWIILNHADAVATPRIPASLAAAIETFITRKESLSRPIGSGADPHAEWAGYEAAFQTLKTLFEKEFPHVGS